MSHLGQAVRFQEILRRLAMIYEASSKTRPGSGLIQVYLHYDPDRLSDFASQPACLDSIAHASDGHDHSVHPPDHGNYPVTARTDERTGGVSCLFTTSSSCGAVTVESGRFVRLRP